jgi:hypothetical protein
MEVSKRKKAEFDNIFKQIGSNDIFINIKLFRNLFDSDFYDNFLYHVDNKIKKMLETTNVIILHSDIKNMSIQDTYYYDKIMNFAKVLHKYTLNITKIIIYNNSSVFENIIKLISLTLGTNINDKIHFSNKLLLEEYGLSEH